MQLIRLNTDLVIYGKLLIFCIKKNRNKTIFARVLSYYLFRPPVAMTLANVLKRQQPSSIIKRERDRDSLKIYSHHNFKNLKIPP